MSGLLRTVGLKNTSWWTFLVAYCVLVLFKYCVLREVPILVCVWQWKVQNYLWRIFIKIPYSFVCAYITGIVRYYLPVSNFFRTHSWTYFLISYRWRKYKAEKNSFNAKRWNTRNHLADQARLNFLKLGWPQNNSDQHTIKHLKGKWTKYENANKLEFNGWTMFLSGTGSVGVFQKQVEHAKEGKIYMIF